MNHTNEERKETLIKEGTMYIIPEREKEWVNACNKADTELDILMLEDVLKTVKLLEEGNLSNKEIKKIVDDGRHSGFSWSILLGNVVKVSVKGYGFVEENENLIYGSEFQKSIKKLYEQNLEFPSQIEKFVFEKVEETKDSVIPGRRKEWEYVCRENASNIMGRRIMDNISEVIKLLGEGKSLEVAKKEIDSQNHSGASWSILFANVVKFSPRGYELYKSVSKFSSEEFSEKMRKIHQENEMLVNKNSNNKK